MLACIAGKVVIDGHWVTDVAMIALVLAAALNLFLFFATPKNQR